MVVLIILVVAIVIAIIWMRDVNKVVRKKRRRK
jgi:hypothetical protein